MTRSPMDRLERSTRHEPGAVERLDRLVNGGLGGASVPEWLALLPDAPEGAVERLHARLEQGGEVRVFSRGAGYRWAWSGAALAAACGLMLWVWRPWVPTALDQPLEASQSVTEVLTPAVALDYQGRGHASGERATPTIRWDRGKLGVEVDPEADVAVTVQTREARVRVLGTRFVVERDLLGTHVEVTRGTVELRCQAGKAAPLVLELGQRRSCLPTSTAGLLGRARALWSGGDPGAALESSEQALARAEPGSPERGELLALHAELLLELERLDEARRAVRAYLDEGHTTRAEELRPLLEPPEPSPGPQENE